MGSEGQSRSGAEFSLDGTKGRERLLHKADEGRSEPAERTEIPARFTARAGGCTFLGLSICSR